MPSVYDPDLNVTMHLPADWPTAPDDVLERLKRVLAICSDHGYQAVVPRADVVAAVAEIERLRWTVDNKNAAAVAGCGSERGINDNDQPPVDAIPFGDLALAMGVDEDTLLQRLAGILSKREAVPDVGDEAAQPELGPDAATGCADDQTFAHLTPEQIRDAAEHMGIRFPHGAPQPERWEIDSLVRDVSSAGKIEWPSEPFAVTPMPTPCSVRIWFRRRVPG